MKRLVRRLATVLDVTDTAGAARLGSWFLGFEGLVVGTTGWWLHSARGTAAVPVAVGVAMVVAGVVATRLPWTEWPRRSVTGLPLTAIALLACLTMAPHGTTQPYIGLLALWFVFAGIASPTGTAVTLMVPSVSVYLLLLGALDAQHLVRAMLATCTWTVLGEALAARTASTSGRTAVLERQAETDALTGLLNRRALEDALTTLSTGDVLVVVDLDHFKVVNDRHGHARGDLVLVDFARTLVEVVRATDVVARFGGEEFVLLLRHGSAQIGGATVVLDRLRDSWSRSHQDVTWSAGVARHGVGTDPHETMDAADRALYTAKAAGRDRVVLAAGASEPLTSMAV